MNKQLQTLFTLATVIFCTTSCSVYYTTSQVNNSLKLSVNQADNSLNNLEYQMNLLQSQYNDIQCDTKPETMKQSDKMYASLQTEMAKVNSMKAELYQEYANFQKYTQGKDKIVSGTPEFGQLKSTRENIKSKMGSLQTQGEATIKRAQEFSNYVTKNVVPSIQMVDVVSYKNSFQKVRSYYSFGLFNFLICSPAAIESFLAISLTLLGVLKSGVTPNLRKLSLTSDELIIFSSVVLSF